MCQRYYPIPYDILKPSPAKNTLTILDELGVSNITSVGLAVSTDHLPKPCGLPTNGQNVSAVQCALKAAQLQITRQTGGVSTISLSEPGNLCLTALHSAGSGVAAVWSQCDGGQNQQWNIANGGSVTLAADQTMCLDIMNQQQGAGAIIDVWKCNAGENQHWTVSGGTMQSEMDSFCVGYGC